MPLSPEEKAKRARDRMIESAKKYRPTTYARQSVANVFQRMIRAEYAADDSGFAQAIYSGSLEWVARDVGYCVCVTCATVLPWNSKQLNTGHFLAGRTNSILFVETNVAPQCVRCNQYLSGNQANYRLYALAVHGDSEVERLERLKRKSVSFSREELVDMKISFAARLKAAEESMKG